MSDYTPTTEEVRDGFSFSPSFSTQRNREAGFARWLAQVKAKAWEEGFSTPGYSDIDERYGRLEQQNPYREETE